MAEETYYLIDFENVGLKGLEGAEKLTRYDHVYLFSTRNAPKIDTATLSTFKRTNLLVHEVPAKSQSLDMHLVSYLGYLIGSCEAAPRFVIISNDTDYDDVARFWSEELSIPVARRGQLQPGTVKPASVKVAVAKTQPAPKKASGSAKKSPEKAAPKEQPAPEKTAAPDDKTAVNDAVMKTLSAEKYDNEIASFVASQVTKLFSEKNGRQQIYRSIISKFGQEKGLEIYRHIKKHI